MTDNKWNAQYNELNQRSRWYSSQLWYVPFAYIVIIGLGVEKISRLHKPLDSLAYLLICVFSFAVFVHIVSLKFYERRAVRAMQEMEDPVSSGGGSAWYMSFFSYMKVMLIIGCYSFLWIVIMDQLLLVKLALIVALTILTVMVLYRDRIRTKPVLEAIRRNQQKEGEDGRTRPSH